MATVYLDATTGDDSRTYVQAQNSATPWANPLKANASATAGDTAVIANGSYPSTDYTGAPTFFSFSKGLTYDAANDGGAVFTATSTSYVGRVSASLPNLATLAFDGIVFDANGTSAEAFEVGDMAGNAWTVNHTDTTFKNATTYNYFLSASKIGTFNYTRCTFSGTPSSSGWIGSTSTVAQSGNIAVNFTDCVLNLSTTGTVYGIQQSLTDVPVGTATYSVSGLSGTVSATNSTANVYGVFLQVNGSVKNSSNLTISVPDNNSASQAGIFYKGSASLTLTAPEVSNNKINFFCPAGYGIAFGDSTAASLITGGVVNGNYGVGKYYSNATPHGIAIGQATTTTSVAGNFWSDSYACFLASKTTSGTATGNISRDSYGVDFYAKGCTAFTYKGCTAIQTGKYARRNLAPLSIDSQDGVTTTATTFDSNLVIIAEPDFTRVGALANITVNNNGTYTSNTYIVPDTWDTNTTDRFFVGGSEGGRSGATGYTIDEWMSGTAGSVSATNGTGTISISGEKVIRLPIAQIRALIASTSSPIMSFPLS